MTEPMQRTVLQMNDLADQPDHGYVFLPPPGEGLGPIAITDWHVKEGVMTCFADGKTVAVLPVRSEWRILDATLTKRMTYEASIRLKASSIKETETLEKELFPREREAMDKLAQALQAGGNPTGQYL